MNTLYCDVCDKERSFEVREETRTYTVRDTEVNVNLFLSYCKTCKEEVYNREMEIHNDGIVFNAYKEKNGLLTSHEVKDLREKYGLSQQNFARLLGFGDKTVTRYENGSIQDRAHDNLMRLMKKIGNFRELWSRRKEILSKQANRKVAQRLEKMDTLWGLTKRELPIVYIATESNALSDADEGFDYETDLSETDGENMSWYSNTERGGTVS